MGSENPGLGSRGLSRYVLPGFEPARPLDWYLNFRMMKLRMLCTFMLQFFRGGISERLQRISTKSKLLI